MSAHEIVLDVLFLLENHQMSVLRLISHLVVHYKIMGCRYLVNQEPLKSVGHMPKVMECNPGRSALVRIQ